MSFLIIEIYAVRDITNNLDTPPIRTVMMGGNYLIINDKHYECKNT